MSDLALDRSSLGDLEYLAAGGTAKIFRVKQVLFSEMPDLVYKEYKEKIIDQAGPGLGPGLHSIVESRDRLHETQRRFIDSRTLWPLRLIENDDGEACGVLMRLIPARFFQTIRAPSGEVKNQPRELLLLFMDEHDSRALEVPIASTRTRLELCAQVARSLGLLHKAGVVYGDLSARNVIYDISGPHPDTVLVDCDSVRIAGTRSPFGSQPHTPSWWPPECRLAQQRLGTARRSGTAATELNSLKRSMMTQSKPTDVYKFALLVIHVLDYGRGRSQNMKPDKAAAILQRFGGADLASVLHHSLADDPHDRPTMRDWFEAMTGSKDTPENATERSASIVKTSKTKRPDLAGEVVGSWQWVEGKGWIRQTPSEAS